MAHLDKHKLLYRNNPKFSDRQVNNVDPDQTAPAQGFYCLSINLWMYYSVVLTLLFKFYSDYSNFTG